MKRPTTEEVLNAYRSEGDGGIAYNDDHNEEGFYAWLNELKADAWNDGFYCASDGEFMPGDEGDGTDVNPYE